MRRARQGVEAATVSSSKRSSQTKPQSLSAGGAPVLMRTWRRRAPPVSRTARRATLRVIREQGALGQRRRGARRALFTSTLYKQQTNNNPQKIRRARAGADLELAGRAALERAGAERVDEPRRGDARLRRAAAGGGAHPGLSRNPSARSTLGLWWRVRGSLAGAAHGVVATARSLWGLIFVYCLYSVGAVQNREGGLSRDTFLF